MNGEFAEWTAELGYDPERPEAATVAVRIRAGSVSTRNSRRDDDLRKNYLAVDSFPDIIFASRKVEPFGERRLRVTGDLTIRGITRPVVLEVELGGILATARDRRVAFTATTSIRREDFGIIRNFLIEGAQVVGDEVHIRIDLEALAVSGG